MKKYRLFILGHRPLFVITQFRMTVLLLLAALILSSASSVQQKSSVIRKAKKVDCVTKILAKKLTSLLAHPDIRNHLLTEINQSSKRENILFLDEFLTSTVNISGLPDQVRKPREALAR